MLLFILLVMLQDVKQNAPFVPSEGDMKIQLSSTTLAWVDRTGNILHQWKRTKRGTRGGKNRRQEELQTGNTPRATEPTPRDSGKTPRGLPPVVPENQHQLTKENSIKQTAHTPKPAGGQQTADRQYSDCSSTCELNDEAQAEASPTESIHTPPVVAAHNRQDSHVSSEYVGEPDDFGADQMIMPDPSSTAPHEMAELITRLYGLVNVLQNDNEQVCLYEPRLSISQFCTLREIPLLLNTLCVCS